MLGDIAGAHTPGEQRQDHVLDLIGDLDIEGPLEHGLGDLGQQPVGAVDRGSGGLGIGQQGIHGSRRENLRQRLAASLRDDSERDKAIHSCPVASMPDHHSGPTTYTVNEDTPGSGWANSAPRDRPAATHVRPPRSPPHGRR